MTSKNLLTDTLFLGNLSIASTANDVIIAIDKYELPNFTVKMCYKNGKQCKYCFIVFSSTENCQEAYERLQVGSPVMVRGRKVHVGYGGHRIADVVLGNVSIHSVHVRFCTLLEFLGEDTLIMFFDAHGNIVDVCITEIQKVKLHFF